MPPPLLSDPAVKALAWLLDLAAQRAGYTVGGQPGWASADEIETGVQGWGTHELMRVQARRGCVLAHDARAPGEVRPRWLYRVSRRGLDELARTLGVGAPGVRSAEQTKESRILLRDSTQHAVAGLRAALDPTVRPPRDWVEGEVGWRSSRQLTADMAREDEAADRARYRWFMSEDLRWLVRLGFAEHRVIGKTHIYRLTAAGAALNPLQWKEPRYA